MERQTYNLPNKYYCIGTKYKVITENSAVITFSPRIIKWQTRPFSFVCVFFNVDREYFSIPLGRQGSCPSYMFFFKKDKVSGDRENVTHCRMCAVQAQSLSPVQLFAIPRTIAHQAPLSMGFRRQESWSGSHFLIQGIFLI